jgi:membrane protein
MERCENRCFFLRSVYVGSLLIGYIDISGTGSAYGPAGSLIVILVWVYYTAAILYFGQFTKTYAEYTGAELNQLIMPFMWSNLKRKIVKVLPNTETPDPEVVFEVKRSR